MSTKKSENLENLLMSFEELFVKEIKLSSEFVISSKPQIDHLQNVFLSVTDKKEQDAYYSRTMQ